MIKHIRLAVVMVIMDTEFHMAAMAGEAKLVRGSNQIAIAEFTLLVEGVQ